MKISIIIPVYNVEAYIQTCLNSVAAQTCTSEIECIIVDDCTPDRSCEVIQKFMATCHGRIVFKLIHHEKNSGLSAARNTGIQNATGDYLYFLDSDDSIIPTCLELMETMLVKYGKVDIVQGGAIATDRVRYGWLELNEQSCLPDFSDDRKWIKKAMLYHKIPMTAWNKLIKKDFIICNNLFFKEGIIHEDDHWMFYAAKYVSKLAICKYNTYRYLIRSGSIMNMHTGKSDSSWAIILNDFLDNIDDFCREDQISMIFNKLHYKYVFSIDKNIKYEMRQLLYKLCSSISFVGKGTVILLLYTPIVFNRRKYFYKGIKRLLPYF